MALDLYSSIVVGCLVFIWIVLGLMFMKEYWPRKIIGIPEMIIPKGEVLSEVLGGTQVTPLSPFIIPANGSQVTITVDPPDTSNGGTQVNNNGATEGEGSSSSGSTDGSHSDMSSFNSLHSNDKAQRRTTVNDQSEGQRSNEGPNAAMSGYRSLHSNDQPHKRTTANDQSVGPPHRTANDQSLVQRSNEGSNAAMSGYRSLHSNDQPHNRSQFLHVGQPLSKVGGSSEISSWHSLRSTESPLRRPLQDDVDVSPSLPALLHTITETDHSEDITKRKRKKMHTV